jgi:hypothetical protein
MKEFFALPQEPHVFIAEPRRDMKNALPTSSEKGCTKRDVLIKIATNNGSSDRAIQNALDPAAKRTRKDLVDYTLLREIHQS